LELAVVGADLSGVVFVDEETIASRDIGGLVKAILVLFDRCAGHVVFRPLIRCAHQVLGPFEPIR
jgi:hypothetical protein